MARSARKPDRLDFERRLWQAGLTRVAGVDEAGRGPLAGPVVAGAVIFPGRWLQDGLDRRLRALNDSKQLTAEQREEYFAILSTHPEIKFGLGVVEVEAIDRHNILQATWQAMALALAQLDPAPQHVLVDGSPVKTLMLPNTPIVQGDARSYSIAAASVLAKVTRDRLMCDYDLKYPGYGFAAHKGYGTPGHLAMLEKLGACPIHRRSFAPVRVVEQEMDLFQVQTPAQRIEEDQLLRR